MGLNAGAGPDTFDRMKHKVNHAEAVSQAWAEMAGDDIEDKFAALEKEKEIDRLLTELKGRKLITA
jgi:phage shock protein A